MLNIAGWYVRLLRDEVLAEWQLDGPSPTLHVHCHVSGQERWLAPPHLRNYIFKREMALVRSTLKSLVAASVPPSIQTLAGKDRVTGRLTYTKWLLWRTLLARSSKTPTNIRL